MNQYELEQRWVEGSLANVIYGFGSSVRVKRGERPGEVGRVVALLAIEPQPDYIIEYPDGGNDRALQSDLEPAA